MPISFNCPECGRAIRVKDELAGKRAKCPGCAVALTIPSATASPNPVPDVTPQVSAAASPEPAEKPAFPDFGSIGAKAKPEPSENVNPYTVSSQKPLVASEGSQRFGPGDTRLEVKQIDIVSTGLLLMAIYAVIGLLWGGLLFLFTLLGVSVATGPQAVGGLLGGGFIMLLLFPAMFAFAGFLGGVFFAVLYNLAARVVGGIKIHV